MSACSYKIYLINILLILAFLISGCQKEVDKNQTREIDATVSNNSEYIYDFNFSGDEDGAKITEQAQHYEVSEIYRDSIDFSFVYRYVPKPGYTGPDYVEIEACTGGSGNKCYYKTTFKIDITVTF